MGNWIVIRAEADEVQASAMHRWHGGYLVANENRIPPWERRGILSGHETAEEAKAEAIRLCRQCERPDVNNMGWHEAASKPGWCHDAVLPGRFPEAESVFVARILGDDLTGLVQGSITIKQAVAEFAESEGVWVSRVDYAQHIADLLIDNARQLCTKLETLSHVEQDLALCGVTPGYSNLDADLIARLIPGVTVR